MKKRSVFVFLFLLNVVTVMSQEKLVVFFDFDKYDLNPAATDQLQNWITQHPKIEVTKIYGFCDWKGTNHYNDTLSLKRVKTVLDYLKQKNITVREGYEIKGFGEDFQQSKVQSENRKVLISYQPVTEKSEPTVQTSPAAIDDRVLSERFKDARPGDKIRLNNIYFYNMTPRILPKSRPVLVDLLCALQDNPKLKIEIQGHICCQKVFDINELSLMRARAIYNYLVGQKINRKRLSYKGYGTSEPIHPIPEKNALEEEENRRVEILVLEN